MKKMLAMIIGGFYWIWIWCQHHPANPLVVQAVCFTLLRADVAFLQGKRPGDPFAKSPFGVFHPG